MTTVAPEVKRAPDYASIEPLIELCHAGQLFEIHRWIAEGNPVNPPPPPKRKPRRRSPLEVAIDRGFHTLVQVLLEGGALQEPADDNCPMNRALRAKRLDIVQLLVEHGFDPTTVDMNEVFSSWEPRIMEFFIDRGADVRSGLPLAAALCQRIRTAVGVYKRLRQQHPDLAEQGNIALRRHCREGNLKWVSLLLWAGADPYVPGNDEPEELEDEREGLSALGFAALYEHYEIFDRKSIRASLPGPGRPDYLRYLVTQKGVNVLKRLLENGLAPNDQANGGCSTIQHCLERVCWWGSSYMDWSSRKDRPRNKDAVQSREILKALHLLARHGGKWIPTDKSEIESARRSLMQMTPDYTAEFIWIMSKYRSCERTVIEDLLRTSSIKAVILPVRSRVDELLQSFS